MKRIFATVCLVALLCGCMAACKSNEQNTNTPSNVANESTDSAHRHEPKNGEVTDHNGIIGDADDYVEDSREHQNSDGNIVSDTVKGAGNVVSNVVSNGMDIVSNTVSNVESVVSNATDNNANRNR